MNVLHAYGLLIKPKILLAMLMLYITSFLSSNMICNHPMNISSFLTGLTAVAIAVSGANAMNNYLDREIDSNMARTQTRFVAIQVTGITPILGFSIFLISIASGISLNAGKMPFTLFLVGITSYLVFYTAIFKRKTMLNVFFTAPSVASPVWFGWYLGGAPLYPIGVFLGLLVAIWGPLHLWSLAYVYSSDYNKVDIPMLPSIKQKKTATKIILVTLVIIIVASYFITLYAKSIVYPLGVSLVNLPLIYTGIRFWKMRTNKLGYRLFKLTAPYILLILIVFTLDHLIANLIV